MEQVTRGCYGYTETRETLFHNLTPRGVYKLCTSGREDDHVKQVPRKMQKLKVNDVIYSENTFVQRKSTQITVPNRSYVSYRITDYTCEATCTPHTHSHTTEQRLFILPRGPQPTTSDPSLTSTNSLYAAYILPPAARLLTGGTFLFKCIQRIR